MYECCCEMSYLLLFTPIAHMIISCTPAEVISTSCLCYLNQLYQDAQNEPT
jgi:hypothetical protein